MNSRAYKILGTAERQGPFLFTCEHASRALPSGVAVSATDEKRLAEHWGWDIGALGVTEKLVEELGGQAIAAGFSRLWIDLNRDVGSESLVVGSVEGDALSFNASVSSQDRAERIRDYFEPYHAAVAQLGRERCALQGPLEILSIHSFTQHYQGQTRAMEVGVLFNEHDERAALLGAAFGAEGFRVALNEPYSGKPPERLIYAAQRHGEAMGIPYLELEIRQDLIDSPAKAERVGARVARALADYIHRATPSFS